MPPGKKKKLSLSVDEAGEVLQPTAIPAAAQVQETVGKLIIPPPKEGAGEVLQPTAIPAATQAQETVVAAAVAAATGEAEAEAVPKGVPKPKKEKKRKEKVYFNGIPSAPVPSLTSDCPSKAVFSMAKDTVSFTTYGNLCSLGDRNRSEHLAYILENYSKQIEWFLQKRSGKVYDIYTHYHRGYFTACTCYCACMHVTIHDIVNMIQ
jgi:hypothetical protein